MQYGQIEQGSRPTEDEVGIIRLGSRSDAKVVFGKGGEC